eukprot:5318063-Prymnesium_polylepis.3
MVAQLLVIVVRPKEVFVNRRLALGRRAEVADELVEVLVDDEGRVCQRFARDWRRLLLEQPLLHRLELVRVAVGRHGELLHDHLRDRAAKLDRHRGLLLRLLLLVVILVILVLLRTVNDSGRAADAQRASLGRLAIDLHLIVRLQRDVVSGGADVDGGGL